MRRRNLRLICFDLDNTLYDYGMAEAEAEAHIAGIIAKSIGLKSLLRFLMPSILLRESICIAMLNQENIQGGSGWRRQQAGLG